jgi:hypothetical protein
MNTIKLNTIGTPCKAGGNAGGGNGGGSASAMEYWDISSNNKIINEFALFFPWVRDDNAKEITSAWGLSTPNANITAVALDRNIIIALEGEKMTIGSFLQSAGLDDLTIFGWKQITEEEFYTL